jgi:hypothetical protein
MYVALYRAKNLSFCFYARRKDSKKSIFDDKKLSYLESGKLFFFEEAFLALP